MGRITTLFWLVVVTTPMNLGNMAANAQQVLPSGLPQGQLSPSHRNFLAVQRAAESEGPEAAGNFAQANHDVYSAKQAFAYAALNGTQQKRPDLNAAIDAANQAAEHVLDGSTVQFAPSDRGVTATVKSAGEGQPRTILLSIDAFRRYLNVGRRGQYDGVMQLGLPKTLETFARGAGVGVSRLDQLRARSKRRQAVAQDNSESDTYVPPPLMSNFGKTSSTLNLSGSDKLGYPAPYVGAYSPEIEARANRMFPSISETQEREQWKAGQEQRAIANEINRTKPLTYPMSGR